MPSVLVVDDELSIRESFSLILQGKYQLFLAASGEGALKTVSSQKIDLVYLDIRMPGLNGLETLKRMKEIDQDLEIIMVTAVNDVQKASEAVRLGARDYVVKPFDVEQILKMSEQILRKKSILKEGAAVQKNISKEQPQLIGQICAFLETIQKFKGERVLILGETGTEKELLAELIHRKSSRSSSPFLRVDLSKDLPLPQIKTMLFGREKGSSTVELSAQSGLLEQAKDGSVFINNLEALPEEILKVFSSKQFSRQGSETLIPMQSRLIGAGAPNLAQKNKSAFDFFSEALIEIPPLRKRTSDLPLLVNHLFEKYSDQYRKELRITAPVMEILTGYSWPGNLAELEILIEQLFLVCPPGEVELEDLPLDLLLKGRESLGSNLVSAFEKEYIRNIFEKSNRDKEKAAVMLGINPTVLETKL